MPHFRLVRLTLKSRRPAADEAEGLVAAELRLDGTGVGGVPVEQALLETTEAEEVVLLLVVLDRPLVDAAQVAGVELVVGVVLLARHAVLALVDVELDVAGVVTALQQLGHTDLVAFLGGADEVVVGDAEAVPRLLVERGDLVDELLGLLPAASAWSATFWPCSSVPVRKYTSSPRRRCQRASASAVMVLYAWPRCGLAVT